MICLRLAAPELFFSDSKLITPFVILVIKDSGAERICRKDLQKGFGFKKLSRFKSY
jgi:hypothetical protein